MDKDKVVKLFGELNEDQVGVVKGLIEEAMNDGKIKHSDIDEGIILKDGIKYGSLKDSVLEHAASYGIENIEMLFPDSKILKEPELINNPVEWVNDVLPKVSKSPFARVKAMFIDMSDASLRAKGYLKGKLKKEDVLTLLKRTTQPTTIYKKQKIDRDDVVDITDFDAVAWIKKGMRIKLDEELARAILFGDGRLAEAEDKIDEECIRPIVNDDNLYTIKASIDKTVSGFNKYEEFVKTVIRNRKSYRGSGNPIMFMSESTLSELLLLENTIGELKYDSIEELARTLRVSKITPINEMESLTRTDSTGKLYDVLGIMVNPTDYTVGTNKGGQVSMFDDFDIDYNQQKYLIETRCSGALTKPYSAMNIEIEQAPDSPEGASLNPEVSEETTTTNTLSK